MRIAALRLVVAILGAALACSGCRREAAPPATQPAAGAGEAAPKPASQPAGTLPESRQAGIPGLARPASGLPRGSATGPASGTTAPRRDVLVTSYWTADERFYAGASEPARDRSGQTLGEFPRDFLAAVRMEGWGRIARGPNAGRFIGYDPAGRCYSLGADPLDAAGQPLVAWQSVATGPDIPRGSRLRLVTVPPDASPDSAVRARLAGWLVVCDVGSAITAGRLDIYVGVQDRPDMNRSPAALRFRARVEIEPPSTQP